MNLSHLLSKPPTPAIVTREGAKRLSRWALLLIAGAYVLAGFVGRAPWKGGDIVSTALMQGLANGHLSWWHLNLVEQGEGLRVWLPYWLGAWSIQWSAWLIGLDWAVRLPFMLMLAGSLALTWFGTYYLALNSSAQPLAFAFGGEASPKSYARAVADGGVLAMMASLGLAQIGHEVGPPVTQLFFVSLLFASCSALRFFSSTPLIGVALGIAGLHLSGAPGLASLLAVAGSITLLRAPITPTRVLPLRSPAPVWSAIAVLGVGWLGAVFGWWLNTFTWNLQLPATEAAEWQRLARLGMWFLWPLWPLVLFTLWQWRRHLASAHLLWPLCLAALAVVEVVLTRGSDVTLLIGLPAFAALAAFSLPTLSRALSAFIDWFTLLFFTLCGLVVWVMWVAMLTGSPAQPAANVKRLVPGFALEFSWMTFVAAVLATLAWLALVRWRTSRHRSAIWKSLVLPAGGTVWAWILLTTLWLPVFDYARSYVPLMSKVRAHLPAQGCIIAQGLSNSQWAALQVHGSWTLVTLGANTAKRCDWMLTNSQALGGLPTGWEQEWERVQSIGRPADKVEDLVILKRRFTLPSLNL